MEIYAVASDFSPDRFIEDYESFIWTERYNSHGDFELVIAGDRQAPVSIGDYIRIDRSNYVMQVETSERTFEEDGRVVQKFQGRSLEAVLLGSRVAMASAAALGEEYQRWTVQDVLPLDALAVLFERTIRPVTGTFSYQLLDEKDAFPGFLTMWEVPGTTPVGDLPYPDLAYTFELDGDSVYDVTKTICQTFNLGFRILVEKHPNANDELVNHLHFSVYPGFDRTTGQMVNSPVIFGQNMENLISSKELESVSNLRNVAYVYSKYGFEKVVAPGFDDSVAGYSRRVLRVMADDIELTAGAALTAALKRKGLEALGLYRSFSGLDGEISNSSSYVYGQDYRLGDLVEIQNDRGWASYVRVSEQIFVSDENGFRQYPTLTTEVSLKPGTWLAWPPTEEWVDVEGYWSDV